MNENTAMSPQTAVTTRLCSSDIIPLISFISFEFEFKLWINSYGDQIKRLTEYILAKPARGNQLNPSDIPLFSSFDKYWKDNKLEAYDMLL